MKKFIMKMLSMISPRSLEIADQEKTTLEDSVICSQKKFDGFNFDLLAEKDRVLISVWELEAEINNGGFDQYYFNSSGNLAHFAPLALDLIGASKMSDIVRRANSVFGKAGPSQNWETRQGQLESALSKDAGIFEQFDLEFYGYPDDLEVLLTRYISNYDQNGFETDG